MDQNFERSRQEMETRNESLASLIVGLVLLAGLANQIIVISLNLIVERPSPALYILEGVGGIGGLLAFGVLRTQPPYFWWRKYAFASVDLILVSALIASLRAAEPPELALVIDLPLLMMLLLLMGLRYNTRVLLIFGPLIVIAHGLFVLSATALGFKIPILSVGVLLLSAETAILTYLVTSLERLHRESVAKERLRRFVAPEVAEEILRAPDTALQPSEKEVTILFCDISSFTTLASALPPTVTLAMLNEHFALLAPIIFKYQGTLEKYIGDALMAIWGAPLTHPDDAERAVSAALEMQAAVRQLNEQWAAAGRPTIQIHIGIHSGPVAAGKIGSEAYVQYATIGDTTNLASRICDATQPGEILLSAATRAKLDNAHFTLTPLPPRKVKGKEEALELYRVE